MGARRRVTREGRVNTASGQLKITRVDKMGGKQKGKDV